MKKNLIILLLLPFLIATLCIVTVNTTYNSIDVDVSFIDWDYKDLEPFKLDDKLYPLNAVGVNQKYYQVASGNNLVWSVSSKNADDPAAELVVSEGKYYLKTLKEGEVTITCATEKGNVSRRMTGVVYDKAVILLQPKHGGSQNNIDPVTYYGQFDHNAKTPAAIEMDITTIPESIKETLVADCTDNVSFDMETDTIHIVGLGEASVTLNSSTGIALPNTFSFNIVENGVNVYTYDDLLNCTNRSEEGEIVVLRKNFESLANAYSMSTDTQPVTDSQGNYVLKSNNTVCFGNYNAKNQSYGFANEVYKFTTTYNKNYIEQWNEFTKTNTQYSPITDQVNVGLRVQKDFYGNGFTINMHNLTYPYDTVPMINDQGVEVRIPSLNDKNIFRGPLPFYTLGDPHNVPLVSALGQDNIGFYVDGDGITVNDVNVKNCDFGDRFANLNTVGTVVEVFGNGNVIKNSRMSNGKNVLRSFSSMDLTVKNCMLSNARNFLFISGANEYLPVNGKAIHSLTSSDGSKINSSIDEFTKEGAVGDSALNSYLLTDYSQDAEVKRIIRELLTSLQAALNGAEEVAGQYKGSTVIEDTYFYRSGIASVALESLFNGPFLYSGSPSLINMAFSLIPSEGKALVPYTALDVSGVSYPVSVQITGDTRFYDYKTSSGLDLAGLIDEHISEVANSTGLYQGTLTIDDIFPLKTIVMQRAGDQGCLRNGNVNVPVAFYGGGLNLSRVSFDGIKNQNNYTDAVEVDLLDTYLSLKGGSATLDFSVMKNLMLKTVTTVTGYEPFKFHFVKNGYLLGETPKIEDLEANAKGDIL